MARWEREDLEGDFFDVAVELYEACSTRTTAPPNARKNKEFIKRLRSLGMLTEHEFLILMNEIETSNRKETQ